MAVYKGGAVMTPPLYGWNESDINVAILGIATFMSHKGGP